MASDLTIKQKIELFDNPNILEKVEELISEGLTISKKDLPFIHRAQIPLTFYEIFGFNVEETIFALQEFLDENIYTNPTKSKKKIFKQISDTILTKDLKLDHIIIQKFLLNERGCSIENFKILQEKYDVWHQQNLIDRFYEKFSDLLIDTITERLSNECEHTNYYKFIKWLINSDDLDFDININNLLNSLLFSYCNDMDLLKKLLEKGAIPSERKNMYGYESKSPEEFIKTANLLTEYLGSDKTWSWVKNNITGSFLSLGHITAVLKWRLAQRPDLTMEEIVNELD